MKKLIILNLVVIAFATASFSQQVVQQQSLAQADYLKKSKNQKIAARILFGGSGAAFLGAVSRDFNQLLSEEKSGTGLYIINSALLAGGISLFISASKNKSKAKAASAFIQIENMPVLQVTGYQSFPAMGLRISLK